MTMVVLQWEHKLHCAFFLGNSGEEAMLSQPKHVLVHGTQCPEVPEHPGSCSWQSENMYKVRRMPWVLENMAKLPRRSTIYQTSTANKQHLMDNVGHTTQMLHSYVSLRNQDCKRKLQSKFQEQHVAYSTPLETSEVHHPTSAASSPVTETDLTESSRASRPCPATPMTVAEVKQKCSSNIVWLPLYIQPLWCLCYINVALGK